MSKYTRKNLGKRQMGSGQRLTETQTQTQEIVSQPTRRSSIRRTRRESSRSSSSKSSSHRNRRSNSNSNRSRRSNQIHSRNIQINTPENVILEYSLDSFEKKYKKASPKRVKICKNPKEPSDFPCKIKRTVFNTKEDYDKYKRMQRHSNASTNYRTKKQHYDDTETMLTSQGIEFRRKNKTNV
jgi:hypothetical protein